MENIHGETDKPPLFTEPVAAAVPTAVPAPKQQLERLDLVRFPLVAAIVLIHSYSGVFNSMGPVPSFIRNFLSYGLASIAVPAFFFISGFLFFHEMDWSAASFFSKLKNRVGTILIPYLFWNLAALIYMLYFFNLAKPETAQFWYLQELMALLLLTPVFHLLHKKAPLISLVVFVTIWLFFDWKNTTFPVMSSMLPVLFFYAGSLVAVKKLSPFGLDRYGIVFCLVCPAAFVADVVLKPPGLILHNLAILFGLPAVLFLTGISLPQKLKGFALWLGSASFFVFCFHQPLLGTQLERIISNFPPTQDWQKLLYYFGAPTVVIAAGLLLFLLLSRYTPNIAIVITGGRTNSPRTGQLPSDVPVDSVAVTKQSVPGLEDEHGDGGQSDKEVQ